MKTYGVVFAPEAEDDLVELYDYIADHGSPTVAAWYVEAIVEYCEGLATFAHRGTRREDIRPGLRITNYKRSAVIAFAWQLTVAQAKRVPLTSWARPKKLRK